MAQSKPVDKTEPESSLGLRDSLLLLLLVKTQLWTSKFQGPMF